MKAVFSKKDIFIFVLMALTGILISVTGVYYNQSFLRILPLYVSLVIGLLQSRVNRYASLMGSINSILYGVVYFYYGLYGSAFSAILFSCPVQLLTFIRWNKNKWEQSTVLKKLTVKQRIFLSALFIVSLIAMWILLPYLGAKYVFLDSVSTLIGIVIYFLTMFAFVEYTFLMLINGVITIALNTEVAIATPETVPFLIFSVYSFICIIFAFFQARKLYRKQNQK